MSSEIREMRLTWAGATDQGLVRTQNQDAMYADTDLFVVADGLGSPKGGEVAANLAVRAMASRSPTTTQDLIAAVVHANEVVHSRSIEQAGLTGMGTTLCAMAVIKTDQGHQLGLVNVGDSRAYRQQNGQLQQLTLDHNRVAEMVRHGILTPAEGAVHEQRHTLTRAIGVEPTVDVDHWLLDINGGDRYLLCSDGVSNEVPENVIADILAMNSVVAEAASALVRTATEYGGSDNATALVVDVSFTVDLPADSAGAASQEGAGGAGGEGSAASKDGTASAASAASSPGSPGSSGSHDSADSRRRARRGFWSWFRPRG